MTTFISSPAPQGVCKIRGHLLEQQCVSASRLISAITRLTEHAGSQNPVALAGAKTVARRTREACKEARANLSRHRLSHGC